MEFAIEWVDDILPSLWRIYMASRKLTIQNPALAIYNGDTVLGPWKEAMLPEIWYYLEEVRTGRIPIKPKKGQQEVAKVTLLSGNIVHLWFRQPNPSDRNPSAELWLVNIVWPDQVN